MTRFQAFSSHSDSPLQIKVIIYRLFEDINTAYRKHGYVKVWRQINYINKIPERQSFPGFVELIGNWNETPKNNYIQVDKSCLFHSHET